MIDESPPIFEILPGRLVDDYNNATDSTLNDINIAVSYNISSWNSSYRYNNVEVGYDGEKFRIANKDCRWSYFNDAQQEELKVVTAIIFRMIHPNYHNATQHCQ